ncbi:division/cell wall cluster transcriptional repressor MraZ [Henriciella barbarensis]|uniref:Transcriptional regulator MraZ n=1 Tax=Henriciella barbarensis TaxID=86342 RepID=A0A399QR40_9PROT|nr:division/cell wall cluster transcriptional repressor MraZ [Henriciella barbarensis]RIJ21396.1 division/cell wall cluster transcriptional repressor MraZ [Henriciella barbarensis]
MFVSTYETALDAKGRVSVPASFRAALGGGSRLFLWPAMDGSGCLEGGGDELMALYRQTLARMAPTDPHRRAFMHAIFTKSADLKMDDTGRITLPGHLLEAAGITKKLVFAGAFDRFHIWEPSRFQAFDEKMAQAALENQGALDEPFQKAMASGNLPGVGSAGTGGL